MFISSMTAALGMAYAFTAEAPAPKPLLIKSVRVVVGDGTQIDKADVLIRDGRIVQMGASLEAADAEQFDGTGHVLYPGFIDAYSTSGVKLPTPRASGTKLPDTRNTAPATMWAENRRGNRADVIAAKNLDLKPPFSDKHRQGITTSVVAGGDGTLCGISGLVSLGATPTVIQEQLAFEISLRGRVGGPGGDHQGHDDEEMAGAQRPQASTTEPTYNYPGTTLAVLALMRQNLYDAKQYAANPPTTPDPGFEGLKPLVTGKIPALVTITSSRDIHRASTYAAEFGFRYMVNGGIDAYRAVDRLKKDRAAVIINLDLPTEPSRTVEGRDSTPKAVLDDRYKTWQERMENAKQLHAAGIPLAVRGSLGVEGYLAGVRKLVQLGVPKNAVLSAMTLGAARIFGVDGEIGSVAAGKRANLVLMTGEFDNASAKVARVVVEGALIDPNEPAKKEEEKKKEGGR